MRRAVQIAAGVLVSLSVPAASQPVASTPIIIQPSPDQQADNKVVCKSEASTGSRFQSRVCHTSKEWAEMREMHLRAAHEMFDGLLIGSCPEGGFSCPAVRPDPPQF